MSKHLNVTAAVFGLVALVGCGPGAKIGSGKQSAAEALYAASGPSQGTQNPNGSGLDLTTNISVKCREGGTASLSGFQAVTDFSSGGVNVAQQFDMKYDNCGAVKTSAGVATLNGTWKTTQAVVTTGGSVDVNQGFKGKILFQGAMDDFIEADVVQSVAVAGLTATSGASVSMILKGTITDSSGTYVYDEAVNVTAGNLSVTVNTKP